MTVSNVIFDAVRVRLVADTLSYLGKQPAGLNRKIRVVPALRLAFIVRGKRNLSDDLMALSGGWTDYQDAEAAAVDLIESGLPCYFSAGGVEVTIAAWSDSGPVVKRLMASVKDGKVEIARAQLLPGVYLAPSLGSHKIPASMSDEQAFKVALLQQEIAVRHGLNMCVGGDVEVVEITAEGVNLRTLGEYPNKIATIAQIDALDADTVEAA